MNVKGKAQRGIPGENYVNLQAPYAIFMAHAALAFSANETENAKSERWKCKWD